MNENLTVLVESGHHVAPVREDPHADENHNLSMSRFCLAPCPTPGCGGVCNLEAGHADMIHHCPAGHVW